MTKFKLKAMTRIEAAAVHKKTTLSHWKVQLTRVSIKDIIDLAQDQEVITGMTDTKEDLIKITMHIVTLGHHILSSTQDLEFQGSLFYNKVLACHNLDLMELIEDINNKIWWNSARSSHIVLESSYPTEISTKGKDNTNFTTSRSNFIMKDSNTIKLHNLLDNSKS